MKGLLPWVGGFLVALAGGGGGAAILVAFFRKPLIKPESRKLDAETRAQDAQTEIIRTAEVRAWLDDARADVAQARAAAQDSQRDAAAARSEAVAAWRDREAEAREVSTLKDRVQELERQGTEDRGRIDQLEGIIREARLTLPPWPARRGYPGQQN